MSGLTARRARCRGGVAAWVLVATLCACTTWDPFESERERGDVALRVGDFYDATDAYQRALRYRPEDPEALHGLAVSYLGRGDGENALEVFSILRQVDPDWFEQHAGTDYHFALYQAAKTRLSRGDSGMALDLLRRLRERDPDHPGLKELTTQALIEEGGRLQVAGRSEEAAALYERAVGSRTSRADTAARLAESLIETGRVGTAISVLSDALLRHPDDPRLQALMDRALRIRYPEELPDAADGTAPTEAEENAQPADPERPDETVAPPPEGEPERVRIEPETWPPPGWDDWPDEGPESVDD
jgi:Flp pilus assembly protein TadD